ncbi:MAG: hypothetical protein K2J95_10535 [Lachnospiraceae bacterium]|nr:hypothetical protein [Lachnospiraceae bacterium]
MSKNEISKSKQKRLDIENARKEQQRKKALSNLIAILIPVTIILVICLVYFMYQSRQLNYGKYLTEEGLISNVDPADYIQFDYKNLSYNRADLLPDDATVEADIASLCESLAELSDDAKLVTASENTISLSYTSFIGGVSYNAVTQEDYTIGSGMVSDLFDETLIGHKPGDSFQIEIAYPADYPDTNLAGVTFTYDVTIHGIYITPEFTDELVAINFSSIATTTDGYREYIIQQYFDKNLQEAITDSLYNDGTVLKYPADYLENVRKIYLSQNTQQYNQNNQMFYEIFGYYAYNSIYEMYGYATEAEYLASVDSMASNDVAYYLAVMTVFKNEGMTNTREEVMNYYSEQGYDAASFQELETLYHFNYLAQMALAEKVTNYLMETVTIID